MRTIGLIFLISVCAVGQQRNSRIDAAIPAPGSAGTVTLSLAEYNRLSELAMRKPKTAAAAPLPYVLSRAAFNLRVEEQSIVGLINIDGSVFENGATKVPLISNWTILDAKQATNPLPFMQEGSSHSAVLNGPGTFAVSLNVASPLTIEAGRASFLIKSPAASSSVLTLELPGNHANVRVEPGLITRRKTENGHTLIEATLEPGQPTRIWWTTREIAAPIAQREVRFLSDIKSVVSVGDSQLRVAALCDVTVIQGEAAEFKMPLPAGFEVMEANGVNLESSNTENGVLSLKVLDPTKRSHQFLVVIERANKENKAVGPILAFEGAQRETGELLVEGVGTMELTAKEDGGLRRMDVREIGALARSLVRFPLQAAFRYNRRVGDAPKLQLEWTQFPDSQVLSAVVERATITTLATVEGKSLTEVMLRLRNHSQPFVRVDLPPGAQLVSAEVEGEPVKPVTGADGSRVPLLRTGLNSSGPYTVSFVYLNTGARFARKGSYEMALPRLDVPVNLLTWEVSLPDTFQLKQFGGNALSAEVFPAAAQDVVTSNVDDFATTDASNWITAGVDFDKMSPGQIGGLVTDPSGAVVPNARITLLNKQTGGTFSTTSDADGRWIINGVQPGAATISINSSGFKQQNQELVIAGSRPTRIGSTLEVGGVSETVTVTSNNYTLDGVNQLEEQARKRQELFLNTPSQNVLNLQRRVAGILPVRVDVPKSGKSYRFVRPLVMDEETRISFQYTSR
jgi:hypothetical protein